MESGWVGVVSGVISEFGGFFRVEYVTILYNFKVGVCVL